MIPADYYYLHRAACCASVGRCDRVDLLCVAAAEPRAVRACVAQRAMYAMGGTVDMPRKIPNSVEP